MVTISNPFLRSKDAILWPKKLRIWHDEEGDYLEVLFEQKEGLQSLKAQAICEQLLQQK